MFFPQAPQVAKFLLILFRLDELNNSVGMYSVNYNFSPIADLIAHIHTLVKIDIEVCKSLSLLAEKH
jgi:hypothetical protein